MLTPAQLSALDLSAHTAIIANAGSGKTRVLVERYLRILETHSELHPRNVVAITFTDSSARDLKKKIYDALNERLQNCENTKKRERLLEIKRQLGSAYISTIHSFCIQLLRTYPVEANVDASFTILTSPEDQLLQEECLRSEFYNILKTGYENNNSPEESLLPVFRLFGRRKITSLIHSFLGSRFRLNDLILYFYSNDDESILKLWEDCISKIINHEILEKIDISFFDRILSEKISKSAGRQRASDALSDYVSAKSIGDKLKSYQELISAFFTKEFKLREVLLTKDHGENHKKTADLLIEPYIKYSLLINAYIDSLNDPRLPKLYLDYSRQLLDIFTRVLSNYTEQKINYSLLDYDDVIEYALRLVQIPEIQAELINRFAHILIDEYQDTDAAQYKIAKALTGSFLNKNRLSVVGDPKQSIYSFRNADIDLYFETINEISAAHIHNKPVILAESFRMLSHPVTFINKVSEGIFMEDSAQQSDFAYAPLIEGRNESKDGTVELLLPASSEEDKSTFTDEMSESDEEAVSANEVQLIVLKIRSIVADSTEKYSLTENHNNDSIIRAPKYSDIAILLRSRSHQSELEFELRKNNIPFITYGGRGFYSQAEIIDITNYLRFLINPNDDIALAGVLRSPYFGLSDVVLYRLAPEKRSLTNLWQRLSLYSTHKKDKHIIRAQKQLSENLQLVGRVSTQFLLQKLITESGILGTLQSLPDGYQKIANLEKYQRFALTFGKEGYSGTYDFIERVTLLMERDEMEAQAEPQKDLNAVHLMTIHNAKGLEFPIVFLPYLHTKLLSGDSRRIWNTPDKELGIGVDLPEQAKMQPIVELIKIRSKEKEIEEEKRIFYVAMTRARDHLILSASAKKNYKNTRIGWVFDSLGASDITTDNFLILHSTITRYRTINDVPQTYTDSIKFEIPIIRNITDIAISSELYKPDMEVLKTFEIQLGGVEPSESIGRYSPSQLLTYLECPTKYYLRYQLGLPEDIKLPYYNEADILAENVQGTLFGQILHLLLEKATAYIINGFINHTVLDEEFNAISDELHLSEIDRNRFIERLRSDITNVYSTSLGTQALNAKQYYTELPLRSKLQSGQMLSGIIDRLFLDEDGVWNILDYKTDIRESIEKKKRYEFQLQFYAYLVSLLYDQKLVKAHVLYTSTGNALSFIFTEKDFAGVGDRLENLITKIRSQKKIKSLEDIEHTLSHCPECPYFDLSQSLCIAGYGKEPIQLQTELLFRD